MQISEFRFAFHARDFDRAVEFYEQVLGFERIGGWDREDGRGALLQAASSVIIEIYGTLPGESYAGPPPSAVNLAFRVSGPPEVDAWYESLHEAGVPSEPPAQRAWGHYSFVLWDPDGIPVHIYAE